MSNEKKMEKAEVEEVEIEEVKEETPAPDYDKLMLWSFISIFALLGVLSIYNYYFPDENRPPRPVPTRTTQPAASQEDAKGQQGAKTTDEQSDGDAPNGDASKQ